MKRKRESVRQGEKSGHSRGSVPCRLNCWAVLPPLSCTWRDLLQGGDLCSSGRAPRGDREGWVLTAVHPEGASGRWPSRPPSRPPPPDHGSGLLICPHPLWVSLLPYMSSWSFYSNMKMLLLPPALWAAIGWVLRTLSKAEKPLPCSATERPRGSENHGNAFSHSPEARRLQTCSVWGLQGRSCSSCL